MYQQRFDFNLPQMKPRKCQFWIWQPEVFYANHWCIHFEGYTTGHGDLAIYHPDIPKGRVSFTTLNLPTPDKFANFVVNMLKVYQGFGGSIAIRADDIRALRDGYREGMKV